MSCRPKPDFKTQEAILDDKRKVNEGQILTKQKYLRAKKRVENLKAFYLHFISYVLVNSMLFVFNLISDPGNWWFQYPLFGWGIGLLVHGASTFAFGIFGEEWEEKKIKKYMEKDR